MALAMQGPTLVFDGVCHLCNGSMKWFSERLPATQQVWYLWVQHDDTQQLLQDYAMDRNDLLRSWAYIEDGVIYRGSTAWLMAVQNLKRPWCWLSYFLYVPLFMRETVYDFVARHRYRIFGKTDEVCKRPNKFMAQRMLHSLNVEEQEGEHDKEKTYVIPKQTKKRLLVVGCGPAGMMVAKKTSKIFDVLVVEPKDYYEFTPGILRGMCDPDELKKLHCPLRPVLVEQMGISLIQGVVTKLNSRSATVQWQTPPRRQEDLDKLNRFLVHESSQSSGLTADPTMQDIAFDYCVVASGSAYATSPLWKVFPDPNITKQSGECHFTMSTRIEQMTSEYEKLSKLNSEASSGQQHSIVIIGGGLVGVELAAELCIYYPKLCSFINIYDLAPSILAPFPERSRDYATKWLIERGVTIATNSTIDAIEAAKKNASLVYSCVGVKVTAPSFMPSCTTGERGEIAVNEALQVLRADDEVETGLLTQKKSSSLGIVMEAPTLFGSGRIFAIGDCVRVKNLPPFTKDTYPAEAMAGIVISNLTQSQNAHCTQERHAKLHMNLIHPLQSITLCSLGPHDCMMILNGMYIANGRLATLVKEIIQYTKMSEARNEFLGTTLWSVVPHM
jgi:NADH dehydrogenase FAD-containing subunit/predicted DCC family thiol-disulfide oxidoreductase YuxK